MMIFSNFFHLFVEFSFIFGNVTRSREIFIRETNTDDIKEIKSSQGNKDVCSLQTVVC